MIFALAVLTTSAFAQKNKNEKTETVTTKIIVKDSKGVHTNVKELTRTESQDIKLDPRDAGKVDQDYTLGPKRIQTNVNYSSDGQNYSFESQRNGFKMYNTKNGRKSDYAILRPTSRQGYYIMSAEGDDSFGYFNDAGNFVVEQYNPKTDVVEKTEYKLEVKSQSTVKTDAVRADSEPGKAVKRNSDRAAERNSDRTRKVDANRTTDKDAKSAVKGTTKRATDRNSVKAEVE